MPQPITVVFNPDDQSFAFDPETLRVSHGVHQIMFHLRTVGGGADKAQFDHEHGVFIKGGEGVFETLNRANFQWIEVDDNRTEGRYPYTVTVIYNGEKHTSPDPFILNDPPI